MVASVDELIQIIRSNPFIDGIGYFIEVTTTKAVPTLDAKTLHGELQGRFCSHAQLTLEDEKVLGVDLHEHVLTQGHEGEMELRQLHGFLKTIEQRFGIDHLCLELQFDFQSARKASKQLDELLQP